MNVDSRQQRRKSVRDRLKIGERALNNGLPATPAPIDVIGAASLLRATLQNAVNHKRASDAAALAHALAEASLRSFPARLAIACKRGCTYCCHSYVAVLAPEVFRLARAVRDHHDPAINVAAVIERGRSLRGLSVGQRIGKKLACPLLQKGECSVYRQRPITCRQATSLSLAACFEEFDSSDLSGQVEVSGAHLAHAANATLVLRAALMSVELPPGCYELSEALEVALRDPESEIKWLKGQNVFAEVAVHNPAVEVTKVAQRIANLLAV